jgi:hypothetical protein
MTDYVIVILSFIANNKTPVHAASKTSRATEIAFPLVNNLLK